MNPPTATFIAELLAVTPGAFAGSAAGFHCERNAAAQQRGFSAWQEILEDWVRELAGALRSEVPLLFGVHLGWVHGAMNARGAQDQELCDAIEALREAVDEGLPQGSPEILAPYWRAASQALAEDTQGVTSYLAASPRAKLALDWLERVVRGDAQGAVRQLLDEVRAGRATARDLILHVLEPAQQEVGRLWHEGELSVGEEHFGSRTVRRALGALLSDAAAPSAGAPLVLLTCVEGDTHDIGLALLGALLEIEGWRVVELGASMPANSLAKVVAQFEPSAVAISATLGQQREQTQTSIDAVRAVRPNIRLLVGGRAFTGPEELWRATGADGFASTLEEAPAVLRRLTEPGD